MRPSVISNPLLVVNIFSDMKAGAHLYIYCKTFYSRLFSLYKSNAENNILKVLFYRTLAVETWLKVKYPVLIQLNPDNLSLGHLVNILPCIFFNVIWRKTYPDLL